MNNRFIAFDVETPNARNNRISAIGITIVENGRIVGEKYTFRSFQHQTDRNHP